MLGKEPSRERRSGARRQYRFAVRPLMPVRAVARWCTPNMADNLILRPAFSAEIAEEQSRGGLGNPAGASFYRLIAIVPTIRLRQAWHMLLVPNDSRKSSGRERPFVGQGE